jgi:hypothetical protein
MLTCVLMVPLLAILTAVLKLLLAAAGWLRAHADIVGKISGNIRVRELLQLRGECVVNGNIFAGKLQVEPTATFNGQCHMGANVVDMTANEIIAAAK